MKLGDFLNSINYTKDDVFQEDTEYVTKKYTPFIINRFLSYFPDTIIHVNEMNRLSSLDKKMQYDYLRLAIRKRKRFSKWLKEEYPEDLECIKQYFGYSNEKAKQVLDLLDAEMIAEMKEELDEGGVR
jgi:hypothetical protein